MRELVLNRVERSFVQTLAPAPRRVQVAAPDLLTLLDDSQWHDALDLDEAASRVQGLCSDGNVDGEAVFGTPSHEDGLERPALVKYHDGLKPQED